jgi:hypothetical protein
MILDTTNPERILERLDHAGAHLDGALIAHIAAHPDHYAPALRARLAAPLTEACDEAAVFARSHALVFLAEWRDVPALAVVATILCRPDDYLDGLYDIFEATVPHYGPAALPALTEVLATPTAPTAARIVCVTTLGLIAHHHPLAARSITRHLRAALPASTEQLHEEHELWSWVVTTLAELRSKAAAPQIEALYKAGMLDPAICGRPAEYRRAMREPALDLASRSAFAQPLSLYS